MWLADVNRIESFYEDQKRGEVFVRMQSHDGYYVKESLEQIRELYTATLDCSGDPYETIDDSLSGIQDGLRKTTSVLAEILIELYRGHNPNEKHDELSLFISEARAIAR